MDLLAAVFLAPFANMADNPEFVLEVVIGGLLSGVMYSLVALGFVLIYKASGVFNFAQGTMVLFAALTFVGLIERRVPIWGAFVIAAGVMVLLAAAVERLMLRPLVNQEPIILFMGTIGLAFFLDGFGQLVWGGDVHPLDIGIPKAPLIIGGVLVNEFDLVAAAVAGSLVAALALFFQHTKVGRALRAVADDHQAAQSVGIPLRSIWVIVWSVAGVVGLVAGIMWGSNLGVQFSISLVALKALPVLMLGGFTSVPGAIVGGLIVGVGEKLAEVFWGPAFGGAIEDWFAYALALVVLAVPAARPVRRAHHRARIKQPLPQRAHEGHATDAEADDDPTASCERLNVVDRLLGLGAALVVRIDIRGANDAPGIDHEPPRHRQGPTAVTVAHREVIAKAEINPLEILGQREPETEFRGIGIAGVRQKAEAEPLFFNKRSTGFSQLRRDCDDRRAKFLQGTHHLLQSIQLCDAIGSPAAAEHRQNQRPFGQKLGRAHFLPQRVLQREWR